MPYTFVGKSKFTPYIDIAVPNYVYIYEDARIRRCNILDFSLNFFFFVILILFMHLIQLIKY